MRSVTISIPNRCNEKWETFTATDKDGFCSSCNKVVVDFTRLSEKEILHFFNQKPTNTCGRFRSDQMTTYYYDSIPKVKPGFTLLKAGLISGLLLLISRPTLAQNHPERSKMNVVTPNLNQDTITPPQVKEHKINGVVISREDGSPLPSINIVLQGTTIGTVSGADGSFTFPLFLHEGDVLLFYFIGIKTKEFKIPKKIDAPFQVKLETDLVMLGEVAVTEVYTGKQSGLNRLWSKVKGIF